MKNVIKSIAKNKKAFYDYEILESWEAGLQLLGHEVKSIRAGQVNLKGSYVSSLKTGELFIKGMHVSAYSVLGDKSSVVTDRERKVFLKRKTIEKIFGKVKETGVTVLPLEIYLKGGLIKVQIGLAKGKKEFQKKQILKEKSIAKEVKRAMSKAY